MIPAYSVSPEDLMEVVYATSQAGPNAGQDDIEVFTNFPSRKVHECIKIGKEFELIEGGDSYSVSHTYRQKIDELSREDRDVLLNRALIQYRPFRTFGTYIRKGYPVEDSARKTNVVHDIASEAEYIEEYFLQFGEFAGIIETRGDSVDIEIEGREIPIDSVESVEALRNAIESEAEIRFYLEETIGTETMSKIDEDTENDLVKAFSEHAESPRDSITASGRALEDFLRDLGRSYGNNIDEYESASGAGEVADLLKGDAVIREVQRKRAQSVAAIRAKGGAHGDDRQTGERWRTSPEIALSTAMTTALLIGSVSQLVEEGNQVL